MFILRCYTLFDISNTGVYSRKAPNDLKNEDLIVWQKNRNRQVNLDTILQVISLRSQPENISGVENLKINFSEFQNFGFLYENEEDQICYKFDFSINHGNVFNDGIDNLGYLFDDCSGVPMIKVGTEWDKLPNFLDTSPELRNIYFEVISDG